MPQKWGGSRTWHVGWGWGGGLQTETAVPRLIFQNPISFCYVHAQKLVPGLLVEWTVNIQKNFLVIFFVLFCITLCFIGTCGYVHNTIIYREYNNIYLYLNAFKQWRKKPLENMLLLQITFCINLYSHTHIFGVNNSLFKKLAHVSEAQYLVIGAILDPGFDPVGRSTYLGGRRQSTPSSAASSFPSCWIRGSQHFCGERERQRICASVCRKLGVWLLLSYWLMCHWNHGSGFM